jgi:glycosyltransferase involved in cell wall biosynthesis
VSVIIPCHNSAQRLPRTLAHLAAQKAPNRIAWEVIVVNNASTDATDEIARRCWPATAPGPLRIVHEPNLGLANARTRGFVESRYEYVSFIDDDNWTDPDWVERVAEVMSQRPAVAACFGFKEAVCETEPPWWFEQLKWRFVVGPDITKAEDFTGRPCEIPGAGLTVRKSAWHALKRSGFVTVVPDREGVRLSAGGDTELCCALKLAGWRLWYDPRLRLKHFIPGSRLTWDYLRRQAQGWGMSTPLLDPYYRALLDLAASDPVELRRRRLIGLRDTWLWHACAVLKYLLRRPDLLILSLARSREGDDRQLVIDSMLGRLVGLLKTRKARSVALRAVRTAPWRYASHCIPGSE